MNKKLIAGVVAALLCVGIGWALATKFARDDADRAEKARGFIEAHAARVAEANRKTLENIRAGAARESLEEQPLRERAAAYRAKDLQREAETAAFHESAVYVSQQCLRDGDWKKRERPAQPEINNSAATAAYFMPVSPRWLTQCWKASRG